MRLLWEFSEDGQHLMGEGLVPINGSPLQSSAQRPLVLPGRLIVSF
jgi:hypothetical protein